MGSDPVDGSIFEQKTKSPNCDDCPVERVSWNDIQVFLTKLNAELKKADPGTKLKYRMPTDAEWERAARGGQNAIETTYAGSNTIDGVAWYSGNSDNKTHPVGQKAPNELGLYDMTGNVAEWCEDWYGTFPNGSSQTDPKITTRDPLSPWRIYRGGIYNQTTTETGYPLQLASRIGKIPTYKDSDVGFRVVLEGR